MKKLLIASFALLMGITTASAQEYYERGVFNHVGLNVSASTEGIGVGVAAPITDYLELSAGVNFMPGVKIKGDVNVDYNLGALPAQVTIPNHDKVKITGNLKRTTMDVKLNIYPFGGNSTFFVAGGFSFGGEKLGKLTGHSDAIQSAITTFPTFKDVILNSISAELDKYNVKFDENGDITIVMCTTASSYKGIEGNAALGSNAMVAYWRKFPGKSINPGDNIYIYGPMSEEEASLWTSQGINGEMNFTQASLTLAENQQVNFKPFCKWKAPAPSDRSLTFEISDPSVITLSEDGNTLYTSGPGTSTITATTISGYQSTMTVSVKEVQELVDVTKSKWGASFSSTYNVGWRFLNNTVVDLVVTRVAMMVPDGSGGYQEVVSQDDLNLLARASNGSASGELRVKEENVTKLPTSILRITYTYNGNPYTIDVPFSNP